MENEEKWSPKVTLENAKKGNSDQHKIITMNIKKMCSCKDYLKLNLDIVELESEVRANNPSSPGLISSSN